MKNEKNTFLIIFMIILLIITGVLLYFTFKSKEKITITFNTDSEQKIDSVEIYSGDSIALPILEKKDYDFDGWYIGEVKIDNSYKYKNSTTINARWKKKNYILSFDTDGGNYIESISVKCGLIILPATPEKKGYTFLEWHDINGNKVDNNSNLDCVNQTIKATWEKDKENYTVSFDTDGGTSINVQTVNVGEKVIESAGHWEDVVELVDKVKTVTEYIEDPKIVNALNVLTRGAKVAAGVDTVHNAGESLRRTNVTTESNKSEQREYTYDDSEFYR